MAWKLTKRIIMWNLISDNYEPCTNDKLFFPEICLSIPHTNWQMHKYTHNNEKSMRLMVYGNNELVCPGEIKPWNITYLSYKQQLIDKKCIILMLEESTEWWYQCYKTVRQYGSWDSCIFPRVQLAILEFSNAGAKTNKWRWM